MKYCSLDLELTGFDPLADEILEIGLAFFEPGPEGLKITEEWGMVFQPKGPVHPKILGLTGIKQIDLDAAPALSDWHDIIQEKLNDSVIVGHNTVLDAKFLEAFGFHLSGKFIDTLDLVQFLLPTRHSYNLENLMHYFGIAHKEAHRALGDSLATIALLEQLLKRFKALPPAAHAQIGKLLTGRGFLWQELFDFSFAFPAAETVKSTPTVHQAREPLTINGGAVTLQRFDETAPGRAAQSLSLEPENHLLVVAEKTEVLKLWQQGLVQGIFSPADRFNQQKFDHLLKARQLTPEQVMFCLKILVWLHTNWQTETIIDLNLSFFGGQFRPLISDRPLIEQPTAELICCDYETFAVLSEQQFYDERTPVLWNAHRLEQWLGEGSQGRLSWNQALYLLKGIYNPETDFGRGELREQVVAALAAADLFFGLVNLMILRHFKGEQYVTYHWLSENDFVLGKIRTAAENFCTKVEAIGESNSFPELGKLVASLNNFFMSSPERIKWIEASETNCVFVDRPLHVAPVLTKLLAPYPAPAVIENIPDRPLLDYLLQRLGLPGHKIIADSSDSTKILTVECIITPRAAEEKEIVNLVQTPGLPAAVVFSERAEVRSFYDHNYASLKEFSNVLAQSYSGGSNKILRNFGIRPASILLATPSFIIRGGRLLAVRTVVINGLPEVETKHPYIQALTGHWQDKFPDFLELQVFLKMYLLLQAVYSPALERIHIFLPEKQASQQAAALVSSLRNLPFLTLNSD